MKQVVLSHNDIKNICIRLKDKIKSLFPESSYIKVYPVPRGGIPAAYALQTVFPWMIIVDKPEQAEMFLDDIIDSGSTMQRYCDAHPGVPFFALIDKLAGECADQWVVFPWEQGENEQPAEDNVRRMLQVIGEDPEREGLRETPHRVVKAWQQYWATGYSVDIPKLLKVFEDGGENYDEMVIVRDIPIYSKCEHHLADIFGTATVAYIPNGRIVGLSKLSRVADAYARRLQVQERLTAQIADALNENLQPKGVGVIIRARHMCMESRGICQQGHHTITSALRGVLKEDQAARAEFIKLATEGK